MNIFRLRIVKKTWQYSGFFGVDKVIGGDYTDATKPWGMRDKVQHLILGFMTVWLCRFWLTSWERLGALVIVALAVELIESIRYRRHGWSVSLSDIPDLADVIATVIGGLTIIWIPVV